MYIVSRINKAHDGFKTLSYGLLSKSFMDGQQCSLKGPLLYIVSIKISFFQKYKENT